jgi:hypothetical protein
MKTGRREGGKTGRLLAMLGMAAFLAGCAGSDGATRVASAGPGVIEMIVNAPDDSTGSLVLSLAGGPVDSIVPGSGLYGDGTTERAGATLFVTGAITRNMLVGSVYVPDVAVPYTVSVTDAANGTTNAARTGVVRVQLSPASP